MVETIQGSAFWVAGRTGVTPAMPGWEKTRGKAAPARQRLAKTRRDILIELSIAKPPLHLVVLIP
jgi:hypothetical protein